MEREANPLGWGKIILIMVVVGVATGLLLGLLGKLFGLPAGMARGGVGASIGVVGALLIARRRAATTRQNGAA